MDTLMKADIFFFVTTIVVVLVSIFFMVLLYYIIGAVKKLRNLVDKVEENIATTNAHVEEIAMQIKESFIFNLLFPKRRKRKKSE